MTVIMPEPDSSADETVAFAAGVATATATQAEATAGAAEQSAGAALETADTAAEIAETAMIETAVIGDEMDSWRAEIAAALAEIPGRVAEAVAAAGGPGGSGDAGQEESVPAPEARTEPEKGGKPEKGGGSDDGGKRPAEAEAQRRYGSRSWFGNR